MPTSNATIVQCAMTGYRITCSTRSSRFRTSLHAGSGRTIMNGQTWPWVVSHHDRSWPWWPDSTSEPRYKWGDYHESRFCTGTTLLIDGGLLAWGPGLFPFGGIYNEDQGFSAGNVGQN